MTYPKYAGLKNTPVTKHQQGATLMITLVMLIILTLFAITALNLSNTNLHIVGNMQARMEAQAAGQRAIEQVLSSADNFLNPVARDITVDIGTGAFTANVLKPSCFSSKALTNADLNPALPSDQVCVSSVQNQGGPFIAGAPSAQSWCYDQKWQITATVTDGRTGAQVRQHQGASMRVPAGTDCDT